MSELPAGWVECPLEHIVDVLDSQRIPLNSDERIVRIAGKKPEELVPYYGATGQVGLIDNYIFDEPLVLLGEDGVPFFDMYRRKAYRINGKTWVNNHAHVLRPIPEVSDLRYIEGFLNSFQYSGYAAGTTRLKLTQGAMNKIPVALAPLPEQKRIADKLDTVLARVDACRDRLDRLPALLKRFRQSILAAATSGRLTEDWRSGHKAYISPEKVFLERKALAAKATDRKNLDAFLDNFPVTKGQECELPDSWVATHIGSTGIVSNGSTPSRKEPSFWGGEIPWVSSGEVRNSIISTTREAITQTGFQNSSVRLLPQGTVLIAMIGEGKTRGQSALLDIDACINQNVAGVIPVEKLLMSKYLWYWFQSQYEQTRTQGSGTGPQALNCQRVRELPLNLPPLAEQHEIVRRIEILFAFADRLEARLATARKQVEQLTPALLAKAFRGELVAQDPADEPAAEILKRLAAKRAATPQSRRGRKTASSN